MDVSCKGSLASCPSFLSFTTLQSLSSRSRIGYTYDAIRTITFKDSMHELCEFVNIL